MTTTINASPTNGLVQTADGSGVLKVQSNGVTTNALAWVNFNGTLSGTITPRSNYNCSSVTKNATGIFTLNFTTALSDANYVAVIGGVLNRNTATSKVDASSTRTTTQLQVFGYDGAALTDFAIMEIAVFGN